MLNDGTTQHKLIYAYNHTSAINFFAERFRLVLGSDSKITAVPQRLMDKVERDGKVITRKQAELLDREQDWLQSLYNRMNMTACSEFYLSKRVSKDSLVQFLDASLSPVTDIYKAKLFPFAEAFEILKNRDATHAYTPAQVEMSKRVVVSADMILATKDGFGV